MKTILPRGHQGILGDIFYTGLGGQSRYGQPNWANFVGPVFSDLAEFGNLTIGNVGELMRGEDTHAGAEALRFVRGHAPFMNLWYAKTAIDHLFFHELQEMLSPGFLARIEQRHQRDWGGTFWWQPGAGPEEARAPDISRAWGER